MNATIEIFNTASLLKQQIKTYSRIGKSWGLKEASFNTLSIKHALKSNAKIKSTIKKTNYSNDALQVLIKGISKTKNPINEIKKHSKLNNVPNPELIMLDGKKLVSIEDITEDNYLQWGEIYGVDLKKPKNQYKIISRSIINKKNAEILIPKNYRAINVRFNGRSRVPNLKITVDFIELVINQYKNNMLNSLQWINGFQALNENHKINHLGIIPISFKGDCNINFEIKCELSKSIQAIWKKECYQAIVASSKQMQKSKKTKVLWNPNIVGIPLKRQAS